jgi:outer membrane protein assembly factor BamA
LAQQDSLLQNQHFIVKKIFLMGQKKTKDGIILRELNFKEGDTLATSKLPLLFEQSKKQLLNTNLFNEAQIVNDSNGNVFVAVKEDWYIYPVPILQFADRNFNQWWLSKDFNRLNYGLWTYWYNFTGNADKLAVLLNSGYTHLTSIAYALPFIDSKKHWGIGFEASYSANREVWAIPKDDKIVFFSDRNRFLIWRKGIGLYTTYRNNFFDKHTLSLTFQNIQVADTVVTPEVNNRFLAQSKSFMNTLRLNYSFIFDKRDIRGYPLKGYFLKTTAEYNLYNPAKSFSTHNIKFGVNANIYIPLSERVFTNGGITASTSQSSLVPYTDFRALGYENQFVRGYEYYVIDGKDFALFRSNLKYAIVKDKKHYSWSLPSAFRSVTFTWMAGLFFDAGYVNSPIEYKGNRLPNTLLTGYGVGTDFIFFYDRVIRLELSRNGLGKTGLYLSFFAPL